ncbi:extracellular solute-binding protein [Enterococcus sp. LJL98]
MKVRKMLKMVLVASACLGALAACGSNSSSGNSTEKASKSNGNEIVFWNPFTGADSSNLKKMIDEYNKTNPEFKVKNVSLKEGDMYTKIPTIVNSGKNIPDVNIIHGERIKQYNDNGMLESMDELLSDYPEISEENYVAEAWNIGEIEGSRYSIPLDIHNWGMYYNKELVEKYIPNALDDGIVTFDEIQEAGEAAEKDKVRSLGITWMKPNFLSLMKQNGGSLTDDGINPTLDTDATQETLQKWVDLYKAGMTTKDGEDPYQLFLTGKLIFFPEGIWMRNNVSEAKFDWGLTNSPQLSDDLSKTVNWASSHQFVMFKNEERTDEKTKGVLDFIEWIRTNSLEWARAGQNPASLAILDDEEYSKMPQSIFISTPEQQETLSIFDYKYNGYVSEFIDAHGLDVVFGKAKIEDFGPKMQKEVSDKISKDQSNK